MIHSFINKTSNYFQFNLSTNLYFEMVQQHHVYESKDRLLHPHGYRIKVQVVIQKVLYDNKILIN